MDGARRGSHAGGADRAQRPKVQVAGRLGKWLSEPSHAERVAAEAPDAELVMFEDGNHVCNNLPYRYQPLAADWTRERLAGVG